jgi:hypothetical protein
VITDADRGRLCRIDKPPEAEIPAGKAAAGRAGSAFLLTRNAAKNFLFVRMTKIGEDSRGSLRYTFPIDHKILPDLQCDEDEIINYRPGNRRKNHF